MKIKFTLLYFLLVFSFSSFGQNKSWTQFNSYKKTAGKADITGIWRGYFAQNNFGVYEDRYKFEVQIDQNNNNALGGVTYSYKTTVFYGKATFKGIYFKDANSILINELKLIELKIGDQSQPCLMKCDLEYNKMGNLETLTGTYTSYNVKDRGDCGTGKVYLEKTTYSDFYKEDFLVKKENEKKNNITRKEKPVTHASPRKPAIPKSPNNSTADNTNKIKPGAEGNLIPAPKPIIKAPSIPDMPSKPREEVTVTKPAEKPLPKPDVIKKRNNELIKTFYTSAREIKIELYDNGEIDGDTISVYHNNQLIVSKKRLTDKPITFTIKADENSPHHEFVMVAENLGSIPPNTALMVITAGNKRYETFVTSTEQKNAVVEVEYRADND